jgi:hypothetical protein
MNIDKNKNAINREMIKNLANTLGSGLSVDNQLDFLCAFIKNDVKQDKFKIKKGDAKKIL